MKLIYASPEASNVSIYGEDGRELSPLEVIRLYEKIRKDILKKNNNYLDLTLYK